MRPVTGVFHSREAAKDAAQRLEQAGFGKDRLNLLFPGSSEAQIHSIPTSETEQPGVGAAIGGVLGAALGVAGGLELGTAIASMAVPGVGPVMAVGMAGAALLGAGGLVGGAKVGDLVDQDTTEGLPADEIFFYEDALRQGRSLVIVMAEDADRQVKARALLEGCGAESLDAAREAWWIGLRDAEAEHYHSFGHNFEADEKDYRAGMEAALRRDCRENPSEETLRRLFPDQWESKAFREGFARGRLHCDRVLGSLK